ncbi:hypothetical protein QBC34DRAFT_416712 [Podospora aff. communis PSN243]|uniref:Uncharacterized protein n=1 Tax=Podospora aff. communis PSN243 TaxID=3040156 RepID=A0AAV9G8B6_9PEZI|nr:hypothetical protein QBC34DRAFT_416712 [Podospora aff. communis PSN243]
MNVTSSPSTQHLPDISLCEEKHETKFPASIIFSPPIPHQPLSTMNRIPRLSSAAPSARKPLFVAPRLLATQRIPSSAATRNYATTSSPKEAEQASAESGGSRSKDAAEESSPTEGVVPDQLAEGGAKGRTGGGKPLESSHAPPPKPKIYNASVHGGTSEMTKEQKEEVDAHNREFEKKHGRGQPASKDKVNKSFWSGQGGRTSNQ